MTSTSKTLYLNDQVLDQSTASPPKLGDIAAVNDQNDVVVTGTYDATSKLTTGAYLQQADGSKQYFLPGGSGTCLLPPSAQPHFRNVYPFAMSNRAAPAGTGAGPLLYVLFQAEIERNPNDWEASTFLLHVMNDGTTDVGEVAYPGSVTNVQLKSINNSGVIAALGNPGTGDSHALLLLPTQLSIENIGTLFYSDKIGFNPPNNFLAPAFKIVAKVITIPGVNIQANILQDMKSARLILYEDNSQTMCAEPNYNADDIVGSNNPTIDQSVPGIITVTLIDRPFTQLSLDAMDYVKTFSHYAYNVRDFLTIQIGASPQQIAAEGAYSFGMENLFKSSAPGHSTFYSVAYSYNPEINATIYGRTATDTPASPRGNNSNSYVSDPKNWVQSGAPNSDAYRFPHP